MRQLWLLLWIITIFGGALIPFFFEGRILYLIGFAVGTVSFIFLDLFKTNI